MKLYIAFASHVILSYHIILYHISYYELQSTLLNNKKCISQLMTDTTDVEWGDIESGRTTE